MIPKIPRPNRRDGRDARRRPPFIQVGRGIHISIPGAKDWLRSKQADPVRPRWRRS
jgi:hypothetical protein